MNVCLSVCLYVCMYVCMYVCISTYIYIIIIIIIINDNNDNDTTTTTTTTTTTNDNANDNDSNHNNRACSCVIVLTPFRALSPFAPGVRLECLRPQLRKVKESPYTGWLGGVTYTKKEFVLKRVVDTPWRARYPLS